MRTTFQSGIGSGIGSGHCNITTTLTREQYEDSRKLAWPVKVRVPKETNGEPLAVCGVRLFRNMPELRFKGVLSRKVDETPRLAKR